MDNGRVVQEEVTIVMKGKASDAMNNEVGLCVRGDNEGLAGEDKKLELRCFVRY